MTTRSKILWIIVLILAVIFGYYLAIFTLPANVTIEGTVATSTAWWGQPLKFLGTGANVKFFDGVGNSPCNDAVGGTPPTCRVRFGAHGFYPYVINVPGKNGAPDPGTGFVQIVKCPGCPGGKGTLAPTLVPTNANVLVGVLCGGAKAIATPDPQFVSLASGPVVEWVPSQDQPFTVTFAPDQNPCVEAGPFGKGSTCTVKGPSASYSYTIHLPGDSTENPPIPACTDGTATLYVTP
jgi:hypothetical protein